MLDRLDAVRWYKMEHAYGTAEDVPDLIRQLLDSDPELRNDAMESLWDNLFDQGSRFPATPHVIPFLIELCEAPATADRGEILYFWGNLIAGYFSVQDRPVWGDGTNLYHGRTVLDEVELGEEASILHGIYKRSLKGEQLLYKLLTDNDFSIRAGAAWVLSCLPTISKRSINRLSEQLNEEPNGWAAAAIVFALGELEESEILHCVLASDAHHPAARCMAACQLARIAPTAELIEPLIEFIGEPIDGYERVPGAGEDSSSDAAFSITHLPLKVRQRAVPALCERLGRARSFSTLPLVEALLSVAFKRRSKPLSQLNDLQRQILVSLVNSQELWSVGRVSSILKSHGLPADREECGRLVGVKVKKDEALAALSIAIVFSQMGFLEKAREGIEKAVRSDPGVFARVPSPEECWLFCAKAFAETDSERALQAYDNAVAINPHISRHVAADWKLGELIENRHQE